MYFCDVNHTLAFRKKINTMPIYLHIFNLIVPKKVIAEKYQGGISQFLKDYKFGEFEINQEDDELFSFGQMDYDCLPIDELIEKGLHFDKTNQYSEDFTVIYRYGENFWNVSWLQHNTLFAWHIDTSPDLLLKVDEIGNMTIEEFNNQTEKGNNLFKAIRLKDL